MRRRRASTDVKERLLEKIQAMQPGAALPPREELAKSIDTTRSVVDRLLRELSLEGLVSGGSGKRRSVLAPTDRQVRTIAIWHDTPEIGNAERDSYFGQIITAVRRACERQTIGVVNVPGHEIPPAEFLKQKGIQGLIVIRPDYQDMPALMRLRDEQSIQVVTIAGPTDEDGLPSVTSDNAGGIRTAVCSAIKAGRTEIAFATFACTHPDHLARTQALLEVLGEHNLSIEPNRLLMRQVILSKPLHAVREQFHREVEEWLIHLSQQTTVAFPQVIIASDYSIGAAVYAALNNLNKRVGDDTWLIHFDDDPTAELLSMSALKQDMLMLGSRAVELLVDLIRKKDPALHIIVPVEPISRKSATLMSMEQLDEYIKSRHLSRVP